MVWSETFLIPLITGITWLRFTEQNYDVLFLYNKVIYFAKKYYFIFVGLEEVHQDDIRYYKPTHRPAA